MVKEKHFSASFKLISKGSLHLDPNDIHLLLKVLTWEAQSKTVLHGLLRAVELHGRAVLPGWAGWSHKMRIVLHWVPKTLLLPSSVVVITQSFQTVVSLEVALFFLGSFVEMVWFNLRCCLIYSQQMTFWSLSPSAAAFPLEGQACLLLGRQRSVVQLPCPQTRCTLELPERWCGELVKSKHILVCAYLCI